MKLHVVSLAQAIALVLAITESVCAISTNRSTNLSGSYTSAANWTAGVPASTDTAIFNRNLNIQYNVTFPGRPIVTPLTREVRQLSVGTNSVAFSDSVNFNQLPSALAIDATNSSGEGALMIGDTSGQNAGLSTTLSSFLTSTVTIGNAAGSSGVLGVNGGTFNVTGNQSSRDELIVGNHGSGSLNITDGADLSVPSGDTVIGRYADSVGTATLSGAGSTWMNSSLSVSNGKLTVSQGGALTSVNSLVDGFDPEVIIAGNGSTWTSDNRVLVGHLNAGRLMIQDGGQVTSTGASVVGGSIFDLNGQLIGVGSGVVEIDGVGSTWTNNGPLSIGINDGGLLISDGAQVTSGTVAFGRSVLVQNPNASSTLALVEGSGSMWAINGDLNWGIWGTNTLGVIDGGKVAATGAMNLYNSGTIEGNGSLAGQVNNAGIVSPGTSAGALHIEGNYSQLVALAGNSIGKLNIELGGTAPGTGYDQLLVTGDFVAAGTLNVSLINGFLPHVGDEFSILEFANLTGTFDTVDLPTLPGPLLWNTAQLYTSGVISVTSTSLAGDYNQNGTVDAADYAFWRDRLGSPTSLSNDDTSGVGPDDYDRWRTHFGQTAGSSAGTGANAAVPEPTSLMLVLMMVTAAGWRLRRRQAE